jgi:hypothetical protein
VAVCGHVSLGRTERKGEEMSRARRETCQRAEEKKNHRGNLCHKCCWNSARLYNPRPKIGLMPLHLMREVPWAEHQVGGRSCPISPHRSVSLPSLDFQITTSITSVRNQSKFYFLKYWE